MSWEYDSPVRWYSDIHGAYHGQKYQPMSLTKVDANTILQQWSSAHADDLTTLSNGVDGSINDLRALLFRHKSLKKFRYGLPNERSLSDQAVSAFIDRNNLLAHGPRLHPRIEVRMRAILRDWLPAIDIDPLGKWGPGAVAEKIPSYKRFDLLEDYGAFLHMPCRPTEKPQTDRGSLIDHKTSRLVAVPKDWDKKRLITVEPVLNTFLQQAARTYILESVHSGPLRGTAMDLLYVDSQRVQRKLAIQASKSKHLATVDLSNASDGISYDYVASVFPAHVMHYLDVCRSCHFMANGEEHPLHIYAGMGNATTFAVETLFFSAYFIACAEYLRISPYVSTFGDDVVVPSALVEPLLNSEHLHYAGFSINRTKSYWGASHLRESCGVYAYDGKDITVPRVQGYQNTWEGRLGLSDLWRRCSSDSDPLFKRIAFSIADSHCIPNYPHIVDGFPSTSESGLPYDDALVRMNNDLHRLEYKLIVREQRKLHLPSHMPKWLMGWFIGQIRSRRSSGRRQRDFIDFPLQEYRMKPRWLTTTVL